MAEEVPSDDREAVLEVVRVYFGDLDADDDALLAGPLLDWARYPHPTSWRDRYENRRTFESAEVVELGETRAVVEVRAGQEGTVVRGSREYRLRFDGPAVLEKRDGGWRLVDFTLQGRRRLESLVFGPLAEQEQHGVTVRVLAIDRSSYATSYAVELANAGDTEVKLDQAYALFETETAWVRLAHDPNIAVAPGVATTVVFQSGAAVQLIDPVLALALRLHAGKRKLRFRLKVPLVKPERLEPQRAPRMLPLFRSSWPRRLVFIAVITAASWWWAGWLAILIPLCIALSVYTQVRVNGLLPKRLDPVRYGLDAVVAVGAFLLLWESPVTVLAVPVAVAALVYFLGWLVARRRKELRLIAALAIGTGWLFLLGTLHGPLSPCRLGDGSSAGTADDFAYALFTGDEERIRSESAWELPFRPKPVADAAARRAIAGRGEQASGSDFCEVVTAGADHIDCYAYPPPAGSARKVPGFEVEPLGYVVAVDCGGREWEVEGWYPTLD